MPRGIYKRIKACWNKGLTKETDKRLLKISKNISKALKGRKFSEKHKANISKALRGRTLSTEHIKNIAQSNKGRKFPQEKYPNHGMRNKQAWNKGLKKENNKSLLAISKKLKKNTAFLSLETKKIIRESKIKNKTTAKEIWQKRRTEILTKMIRTLERKGLTGGYCNMFATEFFKYFDWRLNTKGRYGKNEKWIWNKIACYRYRVDYFNEEIKILVEWDEEHHYCANNELKEEDKIRQKMIQEEYPNFVFIRIRERNYFSKRKLFKNITKKDYEVFDRIIENIKERLTKEGNNLLQNKSSVSF